MPRNIRKLIRELERAGFIKRREKVITEAPRRAEQARAGPVVAMRDGATVRTIIIDSQPRIFGLYKGQ